MHLWFNTRSSVLLKVETAIPAAHLPHPAVAPKKHKYPTMLRLAHTIRYCAKQACALMKEAHVMPTAYVLPSSCGAKETQVRCYN
jgi:hypothetical protein